MRSTRIMKSLLLLAVMSVLSGCTFVLDTDLGSDGSGTVTIGFSMPRAEALMLESMSDVSPEDICREANFGATAETDIVPVYADEDGVVSCFAIQPFDNVQDLARIYENYGAQVETLGKQSRRFVFDAVLDLSDVSLNNLGLLGDVEMDGEIEWRLTMPGTPTESNADEVDGSTFIWRIPLGERTSMHAVSNTGGIPQAVLIVASSSLSALVLIGGFFLVTRRYAVRPDENGSPDSSK